MLNLSEIGVWWVQHSEGSYKLFILYSIKIKIINQEIVVLLCLALYQHIHSSAFPEVSMRKEATAPIPTHKLSTIMP